MRLCIACLYSALKLKYWLHNYRDGGVGQIFIIFFDAIASPGNTLGVTQSVTGNYPNCEPNLIFLSPPDLSYPSHLNRPIPTNHSPNPNHPTRRNLLGNSRNLSCHQSHRTGMDIAVIQELPGINIFIHLDEQSFKLKAVRHLSRMSLAKELV